MKCDFGDRHVLAAAVAVQAEQIVTSNVRHFPKHTTEPRGVQAITPDDFLVSVTRTFPIPTLRVIREQAAALERPPMTIRDVLRSLSRCGAPVFAQTIEELLLADE